MGTVLLRAFELKHTTLKKTLPSSDKYITK